MDDRCDHPRRWGNSRRLIGWFTVKALSSRTIAHRSLDTVFADFPDSTDRAPHRRESHRTLQGQTAGQSSRPRADVTRLERSDREARPLPNRIFRAEKRASGTPDRPRQPRGHRVIVSEWLSSPHSVWKWRGVDTSGTQTELTRRRRGGPVDRVGVTNAGVWIVSAIHGVTVVENHSRLRRDQRCDESVSSAKSVFIRVQIAMSAMSLRF